MSDLNPNRHLSGPKGGQFAEKHQSEAANVSLGSPRDAVRADLAAAAGKYEALQQADWAETVWAKHPHASFADVHVEGEGNGNRFTAGVDLYDAEGIGIQLDSTDQAALDDSWDAAWNVSAHRDDDRVAANLGPYSDAFSLDSIKERWDELSPSPESSSDPFAHLSGLEKATAQSEYAQTLNKEAAAAYVEDLSEKILAVNPDAARLYVNRKTDVEYGLTFSLDRVENQYRNEVDVDLEALEKEAFQDVHLDGHVDYEDASGELYINLNPGH